MCLHLLSIYAFIALLRVERVTGRGRKEEKGKQVLQIIWNISYSQNSSCDSKQTPIQAESKLGMSQIICNDSFCLSLYQRLGILRKGVKKLLFTDMSVNRWTPPMV